MKPVMILGAAVLAIGLVGCSDPKTPNKANFTTAINKKLTDDNFACVTIYASFPIAVLIGNETRDSQYPTMEALKKAGLVSSTDTQKVMANLFGPATANKVHLYQLTTLGQQALKNKDSSAEMLPELCFAKPQVSEIIKWTEPGQAFGQTYSSVTYTYKLADLASWANDSSIQAAFPQLKSIMESNNKEQRTMDLILTNIGWETP